MLITKEHEELKLSELGVLVQTFDVSAANLDIDFRVVRGRSGRIPSNAQYGGKEIEVTGTLIAGSLLSFEELKDRLNALFVDEDPYYITKMIPVTDDLYDFETPGESTSDLDLLSIEHEPYRYRYKVFSQEGIQTQFRGKSKQGLIYKFSLYFTTADIPFGQTIPDDIAVTGNQLAYRGTAKNSQLDYPWTVRLTASVEQPGTFTVRIQDRMFEHNSQTPIQPGDVFLLKGIETTRNGQNVNHYTNQEHFVLQPTLSGENTFETTFKGQVEILNFVEFYK